MTTDAGNSFGANEWLVDELYEQYLQDRHSVDPAWWDFFADYVPSDPARAAALKTRIDQAKAARTPAKAAPSPTTSGPRTLVRTPHIAATAGEWLAARTQRPERL